MLEVDIDTFRTFMDQTSISIVQFFSHIDGKVNALQSGYNNIFDSGSSYIHISKVNLMT